MLVLALTSIPPRFATLGATLESLLDQGADQVRLTLPLRYRRFPDWDGTLPALPGGVLLCRTSQDAGPATKWLPAAQTLRGHGARLLICDDDWIYRPGWAARFRTAALAHPGAALTGAGYDVRRLGLSDAPSGARIAQGYSGILFDPDRLPGATWDMPACAFGADDVWLSGMLALAGVGIRDCPGARALCAPQVGEAAPLQSAVIHGRDRAAANRDTAAYMRTRFGVWT